MLVAHCEWYTYRGVGRAGGGERVNRTPTVLVSGGSGTEKKVMAQQGSISFFCFFFEKGGGQDRGQNRAG